MDLNNLDLQKQLDNKIPVYLKAKNLNGRKQNVEFKPGDII